MLEFHPAIRLVHIACVIASGLLFVLRGTLMLGGVAGYNHIGLRALSWSIDTTLLTAALMLITLLHQYPFVNAWLTVKVLLLVVYIGLGTLALNSSHSRRARLICFVAAIFVYLYIISVARAHHPLGVFQWMFS
ncbi:MAG: SirB2 family protein [Tahibacter sp.]